MELAAEPLTYLYLWASTQPKETLRIEGHFTELNRKRLNFTQDTLCYTMKQEQR